MRFLALATDYDGTLAHDGVVGSRTMAALERLRSSGRKTLLVTGRELPDLARVFPRLDLFDRVVAENGALLYRPQTQEERPLAAPPPASFVERLQEARCEPLGVGRAIVATRTPHEGVVRDAIRDLGLDLQVILNKGAVMVLPAGVNKQTGLQAALDELGLSPHGTVAVGDAENDQAMLVASECGVAVANALGPLKEHADFVTRGARGQGVEELIGRLLEDDLRTLLIRRHDVPLGARECGGAVSISPYGKRVLVAGPSDSTDAAASLVERLVAAGYQCCLVGMDLSGWSPGSGRSPGFTFVGSHARPPRVEEILSLLERPRAQVCVSLTGMAVEERPAFFARLLPGLLRLRERSGRPHWIGLGEAHQLLPASWEPGPAMLLRELGGILMTTPHPGRVAKAMLAAVDLALAAGEHPEEGLEPFLGSEPVSGQLLAPGEVLAWSAGRAERIRLLSPEDGHRRPARENAGDPEERGFVFEGP